MTAAKAKWALWIGALALVALTTNAGADAKGDALLAKTDAALNRWTTLDLEYSLATHEPGRDPRYMKARTRFKGGKQLTELLAPPDMKGTKALTLSKTTMYVYLPAFRKMRRVASHAAEQGFMGTTFSQQDMNLTRYSPFYAARLASEDAASWTLELSRKSGQKAPYARIQMTVDKTLHLPTTLRYFNDQGTHVKTETRGDYRCEQQICTPGKQKMLDHTKGGMYTELTLGKFQINPPLADRLFSKRSLK